MVRITVELVRKRSEHNEGEISTLEELSLHQEDLESIEYLQQWCRDLKILLLQSNLISKIENISKLKKLEYLNLALNNIERIEHLKGCESLQKLDLTLNFIGELTSIEDLKDNVHLKILYMTGNPCTDYDGYREFVVATLPQLECLDGTTIDRSERIQATQVYDHVRKIILVDQQKYKAKRLIQKANGELKLKQQLCLDDPNDERSEEEKLQAFWAEPCDNSPETRVHLAQQTHRQERIQTPDPDLKPKRTYRLVTNEGRRLNVNEAQIPFSFTEDDDTNSFILDIAVYKFLDTSLLDVDIHPIHVTVLIKGKVFQMVFPEEIKVDASTTQRSQTTGHLVLILPKVSGTIIQKPAHQKKIPEVKVSASELRYSGKREFLEIGSSSSEMDFSNIVENRKALVDCDAPLGSNRVFSVSAQEKSPTIGFVENPDVPPLE